MIAGPSLKGVIPGLVAAARMASPQPVTVADRSLSFAGALTASDELAAENATVLIPSESRSRHRGRAARRGRPGGRAGRKRRGGRAARARRRSRRGAAAGDRAGLRRGAPGQPDVADRRAEAGRARVPAPARFPAGRRRPGLDRPSSDAHQARASRSAPAGPRATPTSAFLAGARGGRVHRRLRRRLQHRRLRGHAAGARLRRARDRRPLPRGVQRREHGPAVQLAACRRGGHGDA